MKKAGQTGESFVVSIVMPLKAQGTYEISASTIDKLTHDKDPHQSSLRIPLPVALPF